MPSPARSRSRRSVADRQAKTPADRRIVFRIGVNLGDVVVEGDDLLGDGVNVAARLEQLCEPGGVLVSGTAYDHLQGRLGMPLEFTGEQQVKNIARPVRAYRVRLDGTAARRPHLEARRHTRRCLQIAAALLLALIVAAGGSGGSGRSSPPMAKPSIAVLPFDNLGGDEATGRLADGITEDIITDLARFRDLDVIARNSTAVYKGKPVDVRQVGQDLNVRYVLEGSIQRQGDQVRVTAQLIDAATGAHVWSERWDRPAEDMFAVQTEIAEQVTSHLGPYGVLSDADRAQVKRKRPEDLGAYETLLLARKSLRRFTPEGAQQGLQLLQQAVAKDPQLARAWTSMVHANLMSSRWADDGQPFLKAAVIAGRKATELDPTDAYAHAAFGEALGSVGDLAQAEVEYDKALDLNPSAADILIFYSGWAMSFGKPEAGAAAADRAIRLNPNYPRWAAGAYLGYAYFAVGRYDDVVRVLDRLPDESRAAADYVLEGSSLAMAGHAEEAKKAVAKALALDPETSIERQISDPSVGNLDERFTEAMRKAGFPACAKPEELAKFENPVRLPECEAVRTKATAIKS